MAYLPPLARRAFGGVRIVLDIPSRMGIIGDMTDERKDRRPDRTVEAGESRPPAAVPEGLLPGAEARAAEGAPRQGEGADGDRRRAQGPRTGTRGEADRPQAGPPAPAGAGREGRGVTVRVAKIDLIEFPNGAY